MRLPQLHGYYNKNAGAGGRERDAAKIPMDATLRDLLCARVRRGIHVNVLVAVLQPGCLPELFGLFVPGRQHLVGWVPADSWRCEIRLVCVILY
jgi:hypothetical protein